MRGLIYLVDDEPAVCEVTRRMLERAGYTVETMGTQRGGGRRAACPPGGSGAARCCAP